MEPLKRVWAWTKWAFIYLFVGLIGLLAFIPPVVLFAVLFDKVPVLKWILWIFMDDGRLDKDRPNGLAKDWDIFLQQRGLDGENWKVLKFWIAIYEWLTRNRVYNLLELFPVKNGDPLVGNQFITNVDIVIDELYKNTLPTQKMSQDSLWVVTAGLKYIGTKDQDPYQVNQGDIISTKTSVLGTGLMYYDAGGTYYPRYSHCKVVNYWIWKGYRTVVLGVNSNRNAFKIKHQKIKPWL